MAVASVQTQRRGREAVSTTNMGNTTMDNLKDGPHITVDFLPQPRPEQVGENEDGGDGRRKRRRRRRREWRRSGRRRRGEMGRTRRRKRRRRQGLGRLPPLVSPI
eukprot:1220258-Pyramimonas_sp.AAC.1